MANTMYGPARAAIMNGQIKLVADTIRAILVDLTVYSAPVFTGSGAHVFLDSITGLSNATAGAVGGSANAPALVNKTLQPVSWGPPITGSPDWGVFDADDTLFSQCANPTGTSTFEAVVLFWDNGGADSTKRLIALIDTIASGLPVTPNGGDVTMQWPSGGTPDYRIFQM